MCWIDSLSLADLDLSLLFLFWSGFSVFYRNVGANFFAMTAEVNTVSAFMHVYTLPSFSTAEPQSTFNNSSLGCLDLNSFAIYMQHTRYRFTH